MNEENQDQDPNQIDPIDNAGYQPPIVSQPEIVNSGQVPSPSQPPKPTRKKLITFILVIVVLVLVGGSVAAYIYLNKDSSTPSKETSKTPVVTKAWSDSKSGLVFNSLSGQPIAFLGSDGTESVKLAPSEKDYTYKILKGGERSFLITSDKAESGFVILTPDGKTTPVASSLTSLLAGPAGQMDHYTIPLLSPGITTGSSTLLATETLGDDHTEKLLMIYLVSGKITTLITSVASSYLGLNLSTVSRDGNTAYLIAEGDAKINSTDASGKYLISVGLNGESYNVKALPSDLNPTNPVGFSNELYVSKDGNLIAYDASGEFHIYNIQTGKNNTISTSGFSKPNQSNLFEFSPDGLYGYVFSLEFDKEGSITKEYIQIISTATNSVVREIDSNSVGLHSIIAWGWAGEHTLLYENQTRLSADDSTVPNSFHSINALTGAVFDFSVSDDYGDMMPINSQQ